MLQTQTRSTVSPAATVFLYTASYLHMSDYEFAKILRAGGGHTILDLYMILCMCCPFLIAVIVCSFSSRTDLAVNSIISALSAFENCKDTGS